MVELPTERRKVQNYNPKLMILFGQPKSGKSTLYKTRDHDPRWLDLKSYRLETIDEGYVDYKVYRPAMYFDLIFHGKIINGEKILFKMRGKTRDDIWLISGKK